MAAKRDMRREDLIIPYQEPAAKDSSGDMASTMGSTLPMAAMFTRNKYIGWGAVVFSVQNWLSESPETRKTASQPAYLSLGMAVLALVVTYIPLFMPPPAGRAPGAGTGTEAASAVPSA